MVTKNKKVSPDLVGIIILLVIFVPIAIYGTINHFKESDNNLFNIHSGNSLSFYNDNTIAATYNCETKNCSYVTNYTDEVYQTRITNANNLNRIIANKYALVKDSDIYLYDINNKTKFMKLSAIKHYDFANNYYFIKDTNNLWGLLNTAEDIKIVIPYKYDYIAMVNTTPDKVIALKDNTWYILDLNGEEIKTFNEEIVDLSNSITVTKNDNYYYFYNDTTKILNNYIFSSYQIQNNVIVALSNNNYYIIYNTSTNRIIGNLQNSQNGYEVVINNDNVTFSESGNEIKIIPIN